MVQSEKRCSICGSTEFIAGFNERLTNGQCPKCVGCGGVERHRIIWDIYSAARTLIGRWRVLQFAPDRSLNPKWFGSYRSTVYGERNALDIMQTGLPDASFDLVISNHVLEHVSDDVASLREQLRIVGELGIVHCCVPAPVFLWETTEWDFPDPKKNGHYREYGADFAMRMIVRAGPCHSIAIAANDPITNMPDLIYLFSKSNERLAQFAGAIRSHHFAITRVA